MVPMVRLQHSAGTSPARVAVSERSQGLPFEAVVARLQREWCRKCAYDRVLPVSNRWNTGPGGIFERSVDRVLSCGRVAG
jgi:hypothetical protein